MGSVSSDGDLSDASVYLDASGLEVNGMAHENQRSVETQWSLGYSTIGVRGIGGICCLSSRSKSLGKVLRRRKSASQVCRGRWCNMMKMAEARNS